MYEDVSPLAYYQLMLSPDGPNGLQLVSGDSADKLSVIKGVLGTVDSITDSNVVPEITIMTTNETSWLIWPRYGNLAETMSARIVTVLTVVKGKHVLQGGIKIYAGTQSIQCGAWSRVISKVMQLDSFVDSLRAGESILIGGPVDAATKQLLQYTISEDNELYAYFDCDDTSSRNTLTYAVHYAIITVGTITLREGFVFETGLIEPDTTINFDLRGASCGQMGIFMTVYRPFAAFPTAVQCEATDMPEFSSRKLTIHQSFDGDKIAFAGLTAELCDLVQLQQLVDLNASDTNPAVDTSAQNKWALPLMISLFAAVLAGVSYLLYAKLMKKRAPAEEQEPLRPQT